MTIEQADPLDIQPEVQLLALGDTAWTVEFGQRIDPALHARVLRLAAAVARRRQQERSVVGRTKQAAETAAVAYVARASAPPAAGFAAIVDIVPTYRSLTIHYDPLRCDGERLGDMLEQMGEAVLDGDIGASPALADGYGGRRWRLPVCFDDDLSPDLHEVAQAKGLSVDDVIALMTDARFQVYMLGFMPGFPYMGGLPEALAMPRVTPPRKAVPPRSLAVTGGMCAFYPWQSPGGWRLIGRTPVPLFDAADSDAPSLLAAGDQVRLYAIDRALYEEIEADVAGGVFERHTLRCDEEVRP